MEYILCYNIVLVPAVQQSGFKNFKLAMITVMALLPIHQITQSKMVISSQSQYWCVIQIECSHAKS